MVSQFGYDIINVLILNIYPSDVKVRNAMNEINYCKRMKETMVHRGEAGMSCICLYANVNIYKYILSRKMNTFPFLYFYKKISNSFTFFHSLDFFHFYKKNCQMILTQTCNEM